MVTRRVAARPSRRSASGRAARDAAGPGGELDADVDRLGTTAVIRLRGSLRCGTAARLREVVEDALGTGPEAVVLDLGAVVADDELGLWAVPAVVGDAERCGVSLTVVAPNRKLRTRLRGLCARRIEIADVAPADVPTGELGTAGQMRSP